MGTFGSSIDEHANGFLSSSYLILILLEVNWRYKTPLLLFADSTQTALFLKKEHWFWHWQSQPQGRGGQNSFLLSWKGRRSWHWNRNDAKVQQTGKIIMWAFSLFTEGDVQGKYVSYRRKWLLNINECRFMLPSREKKNLMCMHQRGIWGMGRIRQPIVT